jgi:hypothetical protein
MEKSKILKKIVSIVLSLVKSFVSSLSQIIWIFAGMIIISAGFYYLIKNESLKAFSEIPIGLTYLMDFFRSYWFWLFLAIWIFYFILDFKELNNCGEGLSERK